MMIVNVREIAGDLALSGATTGLAAMVQITQRIPRPTQEGILFLDFQGIEIATGSFLRSLVLGLRDWCRLNRPELTVVVANANESIVEELTDLLSNKRDAVAACDLRGKGAVLSPRVLGVLEERQAETLEAVIKAGETDAPSLARLYDDLAEPGANKWNNRLASLVAKGILRERRLGRSKRYSPVLEGLRYGT
jgi:hypothetical protein